MRVLVLLSLMIGLITGCFMPAPRQGDRLAGLAAATLAYGPAAAGRNAIASYSATDRSPFGSVRLIIHWPMGPGRDLRGYHAQLIPDSTAKIKIEVKAAGQTVASDEVARQAGVATVSVTIPVRAYSNMSVHAQAERAAGDVIAVGNAAGVNVGRGRRTQVPLVMTSLYIPIVTGFNFNAGAPGATIVMSGANLAVTWAATGSVFFPSVDGASVSAQILQLATDSIQFLVPPSAAVGRVEVKVDGVPSYSNAVFWPLTGLAIDAPRASWDSDDDPSRRKVLFGDVLTFTATNSWQLQPGRVAEEFGNPPIPIWAQSNVAAGSIAPGEGQSKAFSAGESTANTDVRATLGRAESQAIRTFVAPIGNAIDAGAALPAARSAMGSAIIGDYLYVLGGDEAGGIVKKVERSAIAANGLLGAFGNSPGGNLTRERYQIVGQVLVIGNYLYVFGGRDPEGSGIPTVERSLIAANGDLGPFSAAKDIFGADLVVSTTRFDAGCVRVGKYVYLLGGGSILTFTDTIERAPILTAQGDLGPFENYSGTSRLTFANSGLRAHAFNGKVFVIGGTTQISTSPVIQAATITTSEGDLGNFANAANMVLARQNHYLLSVGTDILAISGAPGNGVPYGAIERIAVGADGTPNPLGDSLQMATARWQMSSEIARGYLFTIGGRGANGRLSSIERAAVPTGGATGDAKVAVR
ncbi:MAG: hypothetical protein FJZ00_03130 [Candidatus Sericytochromatia bacterium]|uniref:Uncharacterized protein n=1 Tax=Candidatus Tanganyikabacteria bacterium TaxID=2961651 RepID=A0A937X1A5_9BACT|nr:hypothetical protein [Candidatus Tanganyikabacteria bacterium]